MLNLTSDAASVAPGSDTVAVSSNDLGHGPAGGPYQSKTNAIAITIVAANGKVDAAPTVSAPSSTVGIAHNTATGLNGANLISVADLDSGYDDVQVTLGASHGVINVTALSGSSTPQGNGVRPVPLVAGAGSVTLVVRPSAS